MSNSPTLPRRLVIAITAAVATTTLAVGVTGASLMGWFAPVRPVPPVSAEPAVNPSLILVPVAPASPGGSQPPAVPLEIDRSGADLQLAMDERPRRHDDDRHHDDRHDDDDDRHEDDDE